MLEENQNRYLQVVASLSMTKLILESNEISLSMLLTSTMAWNEGELTNLAEFESQFEFFSSGGSEHLRVPEKSKNE